MKHKIYCILSFLVCVIGFAQTNYNYTREILYKNGKSPSGSYSFNNNDFIKTTYLDGLGRPIQIVEQNSSPDNDKNIVQHKEYEKNIGETTTFLPFTSDGKTVTNNGFVSIVSYHSNFVPDAKVKTIQFYQDYKQDEFPYSEIRLEKSPNPRILEQGAPGFDWGISSYDQYDMPSGGRNTIRYDYAYNISNEVKKFIVNSQWNSQREVFTNTISANGNYPANSLKKTVVKNENWKPTDGKTNTKEEFYGSDGKVLLTRTYNRPNPTNETIEVIDTYYVYDFYGNLAYVLPPLSNGEVTPTILDQLCYQYLYDQKNRLVEKKLPGKQWEFIVYDKADRIVMSGPVNSPFSDQSTTGWIVSKYETHGRIAYTGFYTGHTVTSLNRKALKDLIYNQTNSNESKSTSATTLDGVSIRYTNSTFPTTMNLLTVNYYDNYSYPEAPTTFPTIEGAASIQNVKGLLTGKWERIVTTTNERKAEVSYSLYNNKYQVIRNYTKNYLGGYIQNDLKNTFLGVVEKTNIQHKKDASSNIISITKNYTYDKRNRLLSETNTIGTGVTDNIQRNVYDALGVLIQKNVGGKTSTPLQSIDYKYNIRGWLTDINNADYFHEDNGSVKDLFHLKINYNEGAVGNSTVNFNGNITSVFTKTLNDNEFRGYAYTYDHLNRLILAKNVYYQNWGWMMGVKADDFYDEQLSYDKNGNILTLYRTTKVENQKNIIDNLSYTYSGNQVMSVTDSTAKNEGFADGNIIGDDYQYDAFGNQIVDKNKKITQIKYNHLNLPLEITTAEGKIKYVYSAGGAKVKKIIEPLSGTVRTTDYLYGFQYLNNELQFFLQSEGYVKPNGTNAYLYVYQHKDHLGNVRLSYADVDGNHTINPVTEILEVNNYYPFGLQHTGYGHIDNAHRSEEAEQYKYLDKEYENTYNLNVIETDFRQYDPALGRFVTIDLLSEASYSFTPYHYGYNNPVFWNDSSGLISEEFMKQIWDNSPDEMVTYWQNVGGLFVSSYVNESGYSTAIMYDGYVTETLPMMFVSASRGGGGHINFQSYGSYGLGEMIRDHTYRYSKYYQGYRDAMWSKITDEFQEDLGYLGTIDPTGTIDFFNSVGYLIRGQYSNAAISAVAIVPIVGDFGKAAKMSTKLLQRFNSVESVIENAGKLERLKGGVRQGFIQGNADDIFKGLSQQYGAKIQTNGAEMFFESGNIRVGLHGSVRGAGAPTLHINNAGQLFKIRITQ